MKLETDGYKIESDGMCVTLYRVGVTSEKAKTPGERKEIAVGHYPEFAQALDRWLEEKIADSTADNLRALRGDIYSAKAEIRKVVADAK